MLLLITLASKLQQERRRAAITASRLMDNNLRLAPGPLQPGFFPIVPRSRLLEPSRAL